MRTVLCLLLFATALLPAVEGEIVHKFMFSMPEQDGARYRAVIVVTHPDRPLPLILMGTPQEEGFATLTLPESANDIKMAVEGGEAAELLDFGSVTTTSTIKTDTYAGSGRPAQHQLGAKLYGPRPDWTIQIDECLESSFIGVDPGFLPQLFSRPSAKDWVKRAGTRKPKDNYIFAIRLKGHVTIGSGKSFPFQAAGRLRVHSDEGQREAQMIFDIPMLPADLGDASLTGQATARCYLTGRRDVADGSKEIRRTGPRRIDLDDDDDDIGDELGL